MSVGRRLRAVALITMIVATAIGGATAAAAGGGSTARPAVTQGTACAGRPATTSVSGACTSAVVAPADVARSIPPSRRLSAGAWSATPRPVGQGLLASVETGEVASCPRPPPADNHSRAPPSP